MTIAELEIERMIESAWKSGGLAGATLSTCPDLFCCGSKIVGGQVRSNTRAALATNRRGRLSPRDSSQPLR
jgi:hypothetical protein